jgi:hypothetical protein
MKKLILILVLISFIFAQESEIESPHMSLAVDGGFLAYSPLISTELEFYFPPQKKGQLSINARFEGFIYYFSPSIGMSYTIGKKHQLLTGINIAAPHLYFLGMLYNGWDMTPAISPKIGYRCILGKDKPKLYLQSYFSPFVFINYNINTDYLRLEFYPSLHLGLGFYLN